MLHGKRSLGFTFAAMVFECAHERLTLELSGGGRDEFQFTATDPQPSA